MNDKNFRNIRLSTLGMGCMRLPMKDQDHIDYEKAHAILDMAYAKGVNYFDTAHVYQGGDSERCLGQWQKKQPRDSLYIATKYNVNADTDYEKVFEEQLERLQTDHIDFYLLHCLLENNIDKYIDGGAIEYFQKQKELGRITYLGFSSHAKPETLTRFVEHAHWDFAQIQFNYFDWLFSTTAEEYAVLEAHDIPIMVMEPVRGGRLAQLTPEVEKMLREAHPNWSTASWALRFVQSFPQVQVILSGMSNLEQMQDNLATFSGESGLCDADKALILEAGRQFRSQVQVPCTECRYCTAECPMEINIPAYLKIYNSFKVNGPGALWGLKKVESQGKPTDCIACGTCTGHCPQNIRIPEIMAELAERMKKMEL